MINLEHISIKIDNFKCFREAQGFERILPLNIIIGKNNSGKSALLDLLEYATSPFPITHLGHAGKTPRAFLSCCLPMEVVQTVIPDTVRDQSVGNHLQFGKRYLAEKVVELDITEPGTLKLASGTEANKTLIRFVAVYGPRLAAQLRRRLERNLFKRLVSDRDIQVEADDSSLELGPNGQRATNILQRFINKEELPSDLIEQRLLAELNSILAPDATFSRILVQQKESQEWEINLEEPKKGRIPMSHTGSGVKTVLLVLINLLVWPFLTEKPLSRFLFGFEELENNVHPAMQRRLFMYLRQKAMEEKCRFFLTTHSNVVIDLFSGDDQAQIVHVTHDGVCAKVNQVSTYLEGRSVLSDLGVKASDLLQSNVVVWVEGPSDRIYFNRWVEVWSNGKLSENVHYQCVPYGGSSIAHWSFDDPDSIEEMIQALRINTNAIVLLDSDKRKDNDVLKENAQRVVGEVERTGGMAWITAGREVENYTPSAALQALYENVGLSAPDEFADIFDHLEDIQTGQGSYRARKVAFARKICPHITREHLAQTLDMKARLDAVCEQIRAWNRLS